MRRAGVGLLAVAVVGLAACTENTAPGNDREAELDPPAPAVEISTAEAALAGVAVGLVQPEIITDDDLARAPDVGSGCRFRFTEVGYPVVVYGSSALVKLNGKLIPLAGSTAGRYADGGVEVTVRPLDPDASGGRFDAEFVLRLPGAPNELGYHGYAECGASPTTG